jgi:hypothetical protein
MLKSDATKYGLTLQFDPTQEVTSIRLHQMSHSQQWNLIGQSQEEKLQRYRLLALEHSV